MVTGELPNFAGEADRAIGQQDFRLADPAGIKDELTGRRVARRVLVTEAKIELAQWDPTGLAAPSRMNETLIVRQHAGEFRASPRRPGVLEAGGEGKWAGEDPEISHHRF
jgi:hypothetical protein